MVELSVISPSLGSPHCWFFSFQSFQSFPRGGRRPDLHVCPLSLHFLAQLPYFFRLRLHSGIQFQRLFVSFCPFFPSNSLTFSREGFFFHRRFSNGGRRPYLGGSSCAAGSRSSSPFAFCNSGFVLHSRLPWPLLDLPPPFEELVVVSPCVDVFIRPRFLRSFLPLPHIFAGFPLLPPGSFSPDLFPFLFCLSVNLPLTRR